MSSPWKRCLAVMRTPKWQSLKMAILCQLLSPSFRTPDIDIPMHLDNATVENDELVKIHVKVIFDELMQFRVVLSCFFSFVEIHFLRHWNAGMEGWHVATYDRVHTTHHRTWGQVASNSRERVSWWCTPLRLHTNIIVELIPGERLRSCKHQLVQAPLESSELPPAGLLVSLRLWSCFGCHHHEAMASPHPLWALDQTEESHKSVDESWALRSKWRR